MSMFLPDGATTQPPSGVADITPASSETSSADIALMQRVLSAASRNPNLIPADFMAYVLDWIQTQRLTIPIGQVFGFSQFTAQSASNGAEAHTTSSTYADPSVSGGSGPTLSGLSDGKYVVLFGGSGGGDFATNTTYHMAVSSNGSTPTDDQSAEFSSDRGNTSGAMVTLTTLRNDNDNTLTAVYRSSDGTDRGNVRYRWIVAIKYANS